MNLSIINQFVYFHHDVQRINAGLSYRLIEQGGNDAETVDKLGKNVYTCLMFDSMFMAMSHQS